MKKSTITSIFSIIISLFGVINTKDYPMYVMTCYKEKGKFKKNILTLAEDDFGNLKKFEGLSNSVEIEVKCHGARNTLSEIA